MDDKPEHVRLVKNDGGPAFPHVNPNFDGNWDSEPQRGGMSLRDYFAGQALVGLYQHRSAQVRHDYDMARWAYRLADEMLKAREERDG